MTINVFEGARRIAMLIAGSWAIGVVAINFWERETRVEIVIAIPGPGLAGTRIAPNTHYTDCELDDASESFPTNTSAGTPTKVTLCFKAAEFSDGKKLVPYKNEDKKLWGALSFSDEVQKYTKHVAQNFRLNKADEEWANSRLWPVRWKMLKEASAWLFGGLLVLWMFTAIVGWIARGFLGIPSGRDSRPEKAAKD